MTERFMFFDSANALEPDRTYNAQEFTDYFKALVTTGIMRGSGNELKVATSGSNMVTTIDTGIAFLTGRFYENDSLLPLTHDTEALGKNRIDRIVVRMDLRTDARHVKSFVKKGVGSVAPVAPDLQRDANVYEISLAQVKVIGGQTFINFVDVVDERGKDDIAPWAGSRILPNFDNATLEQLVNDVTFTPTYNLSLGNGATGEITYQKSGNGLVAISATLSNLTYNSVIATLPVGFRPTKAVFIPISISASNGLYQSFVLAIYPTGEIRPKRVASIAEFAPSTEYQGSGLYKIL